MDKEFCVDVCVRGCWCGCGCGCDCGCGCESGWVGGLVVCVCVHPDSKLRGLARHVPCAIVEAGGHPYHLSWMPNEEGSG